MGLLPANATALERALEEVITELLDGVDVTPIRTLRVVATCPEEWLPYLAWERGIDAWSDAWPIALKRAVIASAWNLHAEKGTFAADCRILDEAGALYDYVEGAGAEHHTVTINVHNTLTLRVTAADLRRAIDRVRRASVHYSIVGQAGLPLGQLQLAGGFTAKTVVREAFVVRLEEAPA